MDTPRAAGPREFWLWKDDLDFDLGAKEIAASEFPHKDDVPKMLHVIEHSAYAALAKERDDLREVIALKDQAFELAKSAANDFKAERDALRAENEKLRRALDLALYYVEGDATWEAVKAKVDAILEGKP